MLFYTAALIAFTVASMISWKLFKKTSHGADITIFAVSVACTLLSAVLLIDRILTGK
jgi:accessory gene regulator protein AgrB